MPALSLASATRDGLFVVRDLAHRIWHQHYPGIITREQIEYMLSRGYSDAALAPLLETPGAGLVLARHDGTPVGFAAWLPAGEGETRLDKLYVLATARRQGVAAALLAHVTGAARARGSSALVLNVNKHNAGAIASYRRMGFAIREPYLADIGGGFVVDDYIMARPLDLR